jgi:hypothetical protein
MHLGTTLLRPGGICLQATGCPWKRRGEADFISDANFSKFKKMRSQIIESELERNTE